MVGSVTVNTVWTRFYGSTGRRIPPSVHAGRGCAPLKPCKHGRRSQSRLFITSAQFWFGELARVKCASIYSPSTRDDLRGGGGAAALVLTGCVRMSATCTPQCFNRSCVVTVSLVASPATSGSINLWGMGVVVGGGGAPPSHLICCWIID